MTKIKVYKYNKTRTLTVASKDLLIEIDKRFKKWEDVTELDHSWMNRINSKFKVGDIVDYVNDFDVCFKNKKIIKVNNDRTYEIEPTDTPWISKPEKNLHLAGTWDTKSLDKKLINGKVALYKGVDDWGNKLFEVPFKSDSLKKDCFMAVEVDSLLYTITDDGEPNNKILHELQFIGVSKDDVYCNAGDK